MKTNLNAIEASVTNTTSNDGSEMIGDTGWSVFDAAAMTKECAREERLFPRHRSPRRNRSNHTNTSKRSDAAFFKATGWTRDAVASMAKECMRDRRLFGGPLMYAAS